MHLAWTNVNFKVSTVRVTLKPELGFSPKRWEEREVPVPKPLIDLLAAHHRRENCRFVFPSPAGNREWHMLDRCKGIAKRAGLDEKEWDLKTFRSTYATRMLRLGFDVRTVQHWMGIDRSKRPCGIWRRRRTCMIGWTRFRSRESCSTDDYDKVPHRDSAYQASVFRRNPVSSATAQNARPVRATSKKKAQDYLYLGLV